MDTMWPVLVAAGLAAGASGTVTGIGSVVFAYPTLLALGLPATTANVTNTVALALGGAGGVYGSRPELRGHTAITARLAGAAALGSAAGAALLLASPPGVFQRAVPFLIAAASTAILLPRPHASHQPTTGPGHPRHVRRRALAGMLAVSVFNGYFAAAGGIFIIAVLLASTTLAFQRINAVKNVLFVVSDLIIGIAYVSFGSVAWAAVAPLGIGLLLGTALGPAIARRLPADTLRIGVAILGLGLAVTLGLDTFT